MHLKEVLVRFNASLFIFYCCLLLVSVLVSLRADGIVEVSFGVVLIPIWIWNVLVCIGTAVAIVVWVRSDELRQDESHRYHFKALIISAVLQLPLFLTEILVAVNIDSGGVMPWRAVFTPLYLLTIMSIPSCVWACWRKRTSELEVLAIINLLQLIFLGIRLDLVVTWKWTIVFIPLWLLCSAVSICLVVWLVLTILSYMLSENQQAVEQKKLPDAIFFCCAVVFCLSFIVFMSLLASRLDNNISFSYSGIFVPLYLCLLSLMAMTFSRTPANPWWFGIRKGAVDYIVENFPTLQEYINVSYVKVHEDVGDRESHSAESRGKENEEIVMIEDEEISVDEHPLEDIYMPE